MAQLISPFNAQQFDPTQGAGQLPVGRHPVIIESSEVKANKDNNGGYLQLNLKIIDGPLTNQTGAYRLNLYHSNQQTIEIAHRQLSAVCHVVGVFQINDSSQLHGIPFIVEVAPQKSDPQYTEVKKVFDMNGNEPGKQGQPPQGAQPQPQGQPQQQGAWGQQPQQQPQQPQQQPQGNGAWGQPQPQGQAQQQPNNGAPQGGWQQNGGNAQQPAQQPQGQQQGGAPTWGQGQQQPAQQPQHNGAAGNWQQGQAPTTNVPWGAQR